MKTISCSELRRNLPNMIDALNTGHEPLVIPRSRKPVAVPLSLEDYASLEETGYLLRSPKNAKRLSDSIGALDAGKGAAKDIRQ